MAEFVITYKRRSGESFIKQFSDSTEALKERLRREAAIDDPDIEIAHISAPSLESLKKSHSRYFMGSVELEGRWPEGSA
ncbi:hypothetical protein GCM10009604_04690 [Corynebacterium aurimucosum]|uniref:hypothetical protein n=1 Tax=Corynebacterium aurimucosum TaxID=169292 RepID=UPI00191F4D91|nr:hypothetical protein [Corynebacterium aurimucosum]QQU94466.1 hypothetical protein I6I66_06495 [Corynebacterium aurimucosum]UTA72638.1 hypothetical protein J3S22_06200 [Corynebacterium aurimucosum]WJY70973.1 hypothetical protein CAURIM_09370 [Corynebacterium aurimucosum]